MDRGFTIRVAAVGTLVAGGLVATLAGDVTVAGVTGRTLGFGLLAAGLGLAATAEGTDGERRTTLLLAFSGGCLLLASRTDGPGRYGAVALATVAAVGALYRDTLTGGTVE
ncbi:hypothetical protein DP107_06585 [Haloglomus irregulare]|jgi:hypothetical protein|uniref:Uncharacterized protein n=1 Tax=Haloglomus irregulare TaxID=2234134 RepID=A0A554NB84_9EURY|nr:hypothetical protein [Haloglomus irregulare]TSD14648.1 hypothetical protein DP107_06585 [Haloglomus irregulare]